MGTPMFCLTKDGQSDIIAVWSLLFDTVIIQIITWTILLKQTVVNICHINVLDNRKTLLFNRKSFYSLVVSFLFWSLIINLPKENCPIRMSFFTISGSIEYRILEVPGPGFDPWIPTRALS